MRGNIRSFFGALLCMLLLACMLVSTVFDERAYAGEFEGSLYANAAVLMDAASGRVLYGKNADTVLAMASTTKIMTCILVLECGDMDDQAQVSAYAASMPKVKLYVKQGESYRVGDLLYSLMLESHNDSAVVLAEYVGSHYLEDAVDKPVSEYTMEESRKAVSAFATLMNEKARKLGCENTWFITPNGLDAEETVREDSGEEIKKEHGTTAAELARIMAYCIMESPQKEKFREITGTNSYQFSANGRNFSCNNHNAFLGMMEGAFSGKTGFTNKAGYCYVGALERDGRTFVVALLACGWPNHKNYKWSDTGQLMKYGLEQYTYRSFLEGDSLYEESTLGSIQVKDGQTKRLGMPAYTALTVNSDSGVEGLLMREDEEVTLTCEMEEVLYAPVKAGMKVGTICYMVDDVVYRQEEIVTVQAVEKINFAWCMEQIIKRFLF